MPSLRSDDHIARKGAKDRTDLSYRLFLGSVVHVDYEAKMLYIEDANTKDVFKDVTVFPAKSSTPEATEVDMPEYGTRCLCAPLSEHAGFTRIGVVCYILSDTANAQQGVAIREFEGVAGFSTRKRGMYRKSYPGETTSWSPSGMTSKIDGGWDYQALDLSRENLDPLKRTHTTITGRAVTKTDYQFAQQGPISRPGATDIFPVTLPDGTKESLLYLRQTFKPKSDPRERYFSGEQDMSPLTESSRKVMEFALDHSIPMELFEDEEALDKLLGITLPESKWWTRTTTKKVGNLSCDDQTEMIEQKPDHPSDLSKEPLGPSTTEGATPRRRGWILEASEGTLVGSNQFDKATYGKVLKPVIFPLDKKGRFAQDPTSTYTPIEAMEDQSEVRLAASMCSWRAPYEYNTSRFDLTKEGMLNFEIGSTLPKENGKWDGGKYEHPHGAGRSVERHSTGSVKFVFGKNRDEEESLDLTALGSTILRLGADDTSLPDSRRSVMTQIRGKKDILSKRELQWWKSPKLSQGDAGDLENKSGGENVSLRGALDGGMFLRLGARDKNSRRRHLMNGYTKGQGKERWSVTDPSRKDSKTNGRPHYGDSDTNYRYHDMAKIGTPNVAKYPFTVGSGDPTANAAENLGQSVDIHAVRDIFIRAGANEKCGQALTLDLDGGILAAVGKDNQGRSFTGSFDGGIELVIGKAKTGSGLKLEIDGDVDVVIKGNLNLNVTGDITTETCRNLLIAKIQDITKAVTIKHNGLTGILDESMVFVKSQGGYTS